MARWGRPGWHSLVSVSLLDSIRSLVFSYFFHDFSCICFAFVGHQLAISIRIDWSGCWLLAVACLTCPRHLPTGMSLGHSPCHLDQMGWNQSGGAWGPRSSTDGVGERATHYHPFTVVSPSLWRDGRFSKLELCWKWIGWLERGMKSRNIECGLRETKRKAAAAAAAAVGWRHLNRVIYRYVKSSRRSIKH